MRFVPEMLDLPLHWKKPRKIFVNSMSDLFHESLSDGDLDRVFAVMALASQHTFQVLTKRANRMRQYLATDTRKPLGECTEARVGALAQAMARARGEDVNAPNWDMFWTWPLPNVWLGVSVEDQQTADQRIPLLLECPASIRFVSYEPALGPVDFWAFLKSKLRDESLDALKSPEMPGIDWVIVGGESGYTARPFDIKWARNVVEQCRETEVACFVKQLGTQTYFGEELRPYHWLTDRKGGDWKEWPHDVRVRDFPKPQHMERSKS